MSQKDEVVIKKTQEQETQQHDEDKNSIELADTERQIKTEQKYPLSEDGSSSTAKYEIFEPPQNTEKKLLTTEADQEPGHLPPELEMKYVNRFRWILFASNFCVNVDLGILPACTLKISNELQLSTAQYGLLGSIVYMGQAVGCVIVAITFTKLDEYRAIPIGLLLNMLSLLFFTLYDEYWSLLLFRGLTGLFQEFICIYFPVWVDTIASEQDNSQWMSIILIGATLGNISGYIIAAFVQDNIGWRWAFYIQSILLTLNILSYLTIPANIVNLRKTTPRILEHQKKTKTEEVSLKKGMWKIVTNCGFLRMCTSLTLLYFVVTGIQFWFSDFLITVMKMKKEVVFSIFTVVSISGPVVGVVFGGWLSSRLGGYNSPKSLYFMACVSVFSVFVSVPIPYLGYDTQWLQILFLWIMLFCGGMMLPSIMGMMLNAVDEGLKTTANSIANTSFNVFGFLPSPYIYGLISDAGDVVGGNKRNAMKLNMTLPAVFSLLMVSQALVQRQSKRNQQNAIISASSGKV